MRILHTSDWHVGKTIRGESRLAEHRRVLDEIVQIVRRESVDVVLVAGDLYESAAPSAEAEATVLRAVLDLRDTGAKVAIIAGNHDNALRFEAIRPMAAELGVAVLGHAAPCDSGGALEHTTSAGERLHLAMLPFCSQRYAVRAADLMRVDAAEAAGEYARRMRGIVAALTADFGSGAVNVLLAHCMVRDGKSGGGERAAQTTFEDYWVDGTAFPATAGYVALGHLHLTQQMPSGAPVWYSGSPLQVDFGEAGSGKNVLIIDVEPGVPARVKEIPITAGTRLQTLAGTLDELRALAQTEDFADAYLRVEIMEPGHSGMADEVRDLLGTGVVEVRILGTGEADGNKVRFQRRGRSPHELFQSFLEERNIEDDRLKALFARLLDEESQR